MAAERKQKSQWYVYMLMCADNSLYTGITTDLTRRVAEHNGQFKRKGAKYTSMRQPVTLVYAKQTKDRSDSLAREASLRKLSRKEKLLLIAREG